MQFTTQKYQNMSLKVAKRITIVITSFAFIQIYEANFDFRYPNNKLRYSVP